MNRTKLLSLTLAAVIMLSVLCGCSQNTSAASEKPSTSEVPVTEAPVSAAPEASEAPEAAKPMTLTYQMVFPSFFGGVDPTTFDFFKIMEEKTGVKLEFMVFENESAAEKVSLMVAGGEYPDMMQTFSENYIGGLSKAYSDGVVADILPLIQDYAPNFYSYWSADTAAQKSTITDDCMMLELVGFRDQPFIIDRGYFIRADWLDDLGLDTPETLDQLESTLVAFRDQLGATDALGITSGGLCDIIASAYGVGSIYNNDWYSSDGKTLDYVFTSDGARKTIKTMADYYAKGLVTREYATYTTWDLDPLINTDKIGIISGMLPSISGYVANAQDPDFRLQALPVMKLDPSQELTNGYILSTVYEQQKMSFSAHSKHIQEALAYVDYLFTEEGADLSNWGMEGVTYTLEDGQREFTDLMLNNPDWGFDVCKTLYTNPGLPYLYYTDVATYTYSDTQKEAGEIWNSVYTSSDTTVPKLSLLAEESESISVIANDITTYVNENLTKFVTGDLDIAENWDTFVATINGIGLETMKEAYQSAYDRYLAK